MVVSVCVCVFVSFSRYLDLCTSFHFLVVVVVYLFYLDLSLLCTLSFVNLHFVLGLELLRQGRGKLISEHVPLGLANLGHLWKFDSLVAPSLPGSWNRAGFDWTNVSDRPWDSARRRRHRWNKLNPKSICKSKRPFEYIRAQWLAH